MSILLQNLDLLALAKILAQVILSIAPALIALYAVHITQRFSLDNQVKINDHQKRQTTFSKLMGIKFLVAQLNVSRFEALIFSDYHEARCKLSKGDETSFDFKEAQRWQHTCEDRTLDIAKSNQELFELIGLVRILFPESPKLEELTARISNFETPIILEPASAQKSLEQLDRWKAQAAEANQAIIKSVRTQPLDDLLDFLSIEIKKLALINKKR